MTSVKLCVATQNDDDKLWKYSGQDKYILNEYNTDKKFLRFVFIPDIVHFSYSEFIFIFCFAAEVIYHHFSSGEWILNWNNGNQLALRVKMFELD